MPQLPPVPGVSRVVLNFLWDGQRCANVLHYLNNNAGGGPDAADIGAKLVSAYNLLGDPWAANTVQLNSITVTPLDPNPGPSEEYITGLPIAGTAATPALPNNVTVATSFRTQFRGRSFRGRAYWIGLYEGAVVNNLVDTSPANGITNFWENIRILEPSGGEAEYQLCVVSYYSNKQLRATPLATPVTSVQTDRTIDSQRRRLPGRGR